MNHKWKFGYFGICLIGMILMMTLVACRTEMIEIEENNTYRWQKYMNIEEYNQLEKGMSYIDVAKIVGGKGVKIDGNLYEWNDEIILTKGYQVYFEDGNLTEMKIIERKGYSNR